MTIRLENVPFKAVLRLILRDARMNYRMEEDEILVVTVDQGKRQTKIYSVADLTAGEGSRADKLIQLISRTIARKSWRQAGGAGTLDYFPAGMALGINQTSDVHEQIAESLEAIHGLFENRDQKMHPYLGRADLTPSENEPRLVGAVRARPAAPAMLCSAPAVAPL
jgi:hypothetical protein